MLIRGQISPLIKNDVRLINIGGIQRTKSKHVSDGNPINNRGGADFEIFFSCSTVRGFYHSALNAI